MSDGFDARIFSEFEQFHQSIQSTIESTNNELHLRQVSNRNLKWKVDLRLNTSVKAYPVV